jgi:hypothetical protein
MTHISFTSGQIQDIIDCLDEKETALYDAGDKYLASYYLNMGSQFQHVYDRLQELPGEKRVANLVLAFD